MKSRRFLQLLALSVALGLGAATWLRSTPPPADPAQRLDVTALPQEPLCCTAGPLHLVGAWQLRSRNAMFGGYSALIRTEAGRLLAMSDRGYYLSLPMPDRMAVGAPGEVRFGPLLSDESQLKANRDIEAASRDPATGRIWLAQEGRNSIERRASDLSREAFSQPPRMKFWPANTGPEALIRLSDGRFVVLCECSDGFLSSGRHPALLFSTDPAEGGEAAKFRFAGAEGYRPTDMAELPDGRVLVLVRRLVWPVPARFAIKVLIADPHQITPGGTWQAREIANLAAPWPLDNYEGLAIERAANGRLVAWIISDENGAAAQRVLLLKVEIDESRI